MRPGFHGLNAVLGEHAWQQSGGEQLVPGPLSRRMLEDFFEFHADTFAADDRDAGRMPRDRVSGLWFQRQFESSGKSDGSQHAKFVFFDAGGGVPDGAEDAVCEVLLAFDEIDDMMTEGVVEQAVDRKVAALGVLFGRGEGDPIGSAAIRVDAIGSKSRDLHLAFSTAATTMDEHHAEGFADRARLMEAENVPDVVDPRVGCDIEVLRLDFEQRVSYAASRKVGDKSRIDQLLHDRTSELEVDRVCGIQRRLGHRGLVRTHPSAIEEEKEYHYRS